MTFVRSVCDVFNLFKAIEEVRVLIKMYCSLITVSYISVCVFVRFFPVLSCMFFCMHVLHGSNQKIAKTVPDPLKCKHMHTISLLSVQSFCVCVCV